ncbi:ketoacyl-ACP synthase III [Sphingopyxis sp. DBS4]|uniref:ketoacyl-ACP synthase III n=1 Tax=Sphingopyxis sp. DBS4 TaxID=2968500 RepID=UPI00214B5832|nr:ketoacyl-ACP synthase III [Sphingopyxis sp. DBS4]
MQNSSERAELRFANASIRGIVTTVGDRTVEFAQEAPAMGLTEADVARLKRAIGLDRRQIVSGDKTTSDLCEHSARHLLSGCGIEASDCQAIIFVSQTPDYTAPATAISLQARLGLPITSMAFDVRLGCSGFVYGLSMAFSLVESGLNRVLLCVGDVASKFVDPTDHSIAPIMGDAGAAILVERRPSKSYFQFYSDGTGARALIIPNSGVRKTPEDEGMPELMHMDGAAVFNFTLQRVPSMIADILAYGGRDAADIDYFVLHQPNKYILKNIQKRMKVDDAKLPSDTQSVYGNQNSASIPGTISGFLSDRFSTSRLTSVFSGFGIGLSWAAAIVETDAIFAPATFIGTGK